MKVYNGKFVLNYGEYCSSNNLKNPPKEMITKWIDDVVRAYRKGMRTESIMQIFDIPKSKKGKIDTHEYTVKDVNHEIDKEKKNLTIFLQLSIT